MATLGVAGGAHAEAEHRVQAWWNAYAFGELGPVARVYFEVQPRLELTPDFRIDRLLLRSALGAKVAPGLTVWLGFACVFRWASDLVDAVTIHEGRLFQQVLYERELGSLGLVLRFRLEERLLEEVRGLLWRTRLLVRSTWRFLDSPVLYAVVQDELFVNLNARPRSPPAGFDQNRAFGGIGWRPTSTSLLELGYQLQVLPLPPPAPTLLGHAVLLNTALAF